MNTQYRNTMIATVKSLSRDQYGRISHVDFSRLDEQAKADRKDGVISVLDYVNVRSLLGEAVNLPRRYSPRAEAAAERFQPYGA